MISQSILKLLLLYFLLSHTLISAQQNKKQIDSLLNLIENTKVDTVKAKIYLEIANTYKLTNPEQNNAYAEKALKIYQNYNDYSGLAKTYRAKYYYFYVIGRLDSANHYLNNAIVKFMQAKDTLNAARLKYNQAYYEITRGNFRPADSIINTVTPIYIKFNDSITLGRAYILKGMIAGSKGYGNIALQEYFKSLDIYRKKGDKLRISEALLAIGIEYHQSEDFEKAISAFNENLTIAEEIGVPQYVAQSSNFIGASYLELNKLKEAEEYLNKSLKKSEEVGFQYNIGKTYINLGHLKFKQKKYNEATNYFSKGMAIFKTMKIPVEQSIILLSLGRIHLNKGAYQLAIKKFDEGMTIAKIANDMDLIRSAYLYKSEALDALGDSRNALKIYKKSKKLNDSIFNAKNSLKTKELQIMFETERKEQQIVQQETEIGLLKEKEKVSTLQKTLLGGGFTLSLLIFGLGFYGIRQKMKRNKIEKEKVDAELDFKTKELTTHALHLAKKNEVLNDLKQKAKTLKDSSQEGNGYQQLIQTINFDLQDDNNWENFSRYFEEVHKDFSTTAQQKYPNITANDLRFMALLKMNLTSKEIANILNISNDGIKKARQRLRKKLGINSTESLEALVISI